MPRYGYTAFHPAWLAGYRCWFTSRTDVSCGFSTADHHTCLPSADVMTYYAKQTLRMDVHRRYSLARWRSCDPSYIHHPAHAPLPVYGTTAPRAAANGAPHAGGLYEHTRRAWLPAFCYLAPTLWCFSGNLPAATYFNVLRSVARDWRPGFPGRRLFLLPGTG